MSARTTRRTPAKGFRMQAKGRDDADFRVMTSLPEDDFNILKWWAEKHQRPLSEELRRAVWAYVHCLRPDYPGKQQKETA